MVLGCALGPARSSGRYRSLPVSGSRSGPVARPAGKASPCPARMILNRPARPAALAGQSAVACTAPQGPADQLVAALSVIARDGRRASRLRIGPDRCAEIERHPGDLVRRTPRARLVRDQRPKRLGSRSSRTPAQPARYKLGSRRPFPHRKTLRSRYSRPDPTTRDCRLMKDALTTARNFRTQPAAPAFENC
jgi:hypothetical protein